MKLKVDFVTNSSSASFVILKKHLLQCQIDLIYEHCEIGSILAKEEGVEIYPDEWRITETKTEIEGYTSMDNFDMEWFLEKIGIKRKYIQFSGSNYGCY